MAGLSTCCIPIGGYSSSFHLHVRGRPYGRLASARWRALGLSGVGDGPAGLAAGRVKAEENPIGIRKCTIGLVKNSASGGSSSIMRKMVPRKTTAIQLLYHWPGNIADPTNSQPKLRNFRGTNACKARFHHAGAIHCFDRGSCVNWWQSRLRRNGSRGHLHTDLRNRFQWLIGRSERRRVRQGWAELLQSTDQSPWPGNAAAGIVGIVSECVASSAQETEVSESVVQTGMMGTEGEASDE
ncbi:hypothetical protein B0H19DRAFT_1066784 [Mycena capillaripes]|nr:hypothetical protein B0H19DRAFT_1066784 [Mycena capillaripes]